MMSKEQKSQIKMSMNDKWHLVKLTHVWPDGHLINQMAHALLESNAELLSLCEQLAELKALEPFKYAVVGGDGEDIGTTKSLSDAEYMVIRYRGNIVPLFTAAKPAEDK